MNAADTITKPAAATAERPAGAPWPLADARKFLNISERTLRNMARDGRVRVIKVGGRPMVPDAEVRRLAADGE